MDYRATRAADNLEVPPIRQVKSKYGGLRIYVSGGDDEAFSKVIHQAVAEAEKIAYDTCEVCGARGAKTINMRGWIVTQCPTCFIKTDAKDKIDG